MKDYHGPAVFVSVLCLFAASLYGQVPCQPVVVGKDTIDGAQDSVMECLSNHYFKGEWRLLQEQFDELFKKGMKIGCHTIDPKKHFYFVIFLSNRPGEESRLVRIPWSHPYPDPYAARLKGEKQVFEILLGAQDELTIKTSYSSSEIENPLLAQIPQFAKTIEPAIFSVIQAVREREEMAAKEVPRKMKITLRSVSLPFRRAKILIKDTAFLGEAAIKASVAKLADGISTRIASGSRVGTHLARLIQKELDSMPAPAQGESITDKMSVTVRQTYEGFIKRRRPKDDNLTLAIAIEKEFLDKIGKAAEAQAESEYEYENIPLEWINFGLISAFFFSNSFTAERVKVTDEGLYVADPPANPLTAAIVNVYPFRYDPKSAKMRLAEILRPFAGVVLTPDAGICTGLAISPLRGISVNGGIAFMGSHVARNPKIEQVDGQDVKKVTNPGNPLKTKWCHVYFVGLGYNFK